MIKIRYGVFETNSSSVHSMTICSAGDYIRWLKGEVLFNTEYKYNDWPQFISPDEASKYDKYYPYPKEKVDPYDSSFFEVVNEDGDTEWHERTLITFYEYQGCIDDCFNQFKEVHTTPSGDEVVAFGYYGYDG